MRENFPMASHDLFTITKMRARQMRRERETSRHEPMNMHARNETPMTRSRNEGESDCGLLSFITVALLLENNDEQRGIAAITGGMQCKNKLSTFDFFLG
jgi:hypothetical protein